MAKKTTKRPVRPRELSTATKEQPYGVGVGGKPKLAGQKADKVTLDELAKPPMPYGCRECPHNKMATDEQRAAWRIAYASALFCDHIDVPGWPANEVSNKFVPAPDWCPLRR